MELPTTAELFRNVLAVALFTGALTAWLKVFIKGRIEEPGNVQLEGKADVLILGLALALGIATTVVAQCVLTWPPAPEDLFSAALTGFFGATLSSFGAKFVMGLTAWIGPAA